MTDPTLTTPPGTPAPAPATPAQPPSRGYRYRWIVLGLVLAAECVDMVDATIVNIAAPTIRRELGGGTTTMQWYLAAYTLAFAITLVVSARVGDMLGRKTMFCIGMAGFTVASILCGVAANPEMLIVCRAVEGLFGAMMVPQGLALIKGSFPADELAKAFTMFGPVMGIASIAGPIIAGVLLDADLFGTGWRMIFLINVPVGVLALIGALRFMPQLRLPGEPVRLDPLGAVLLTLASALLVYPLIEGRSLGWPVWTYLLMAGSLVGFWLFFAGERRSRHPIIEPTLFRQRAFLGGMAVILSMFVGFMGLMLVLNLFTQVGLHYSPLKAGLTFVPWSVGIAVGAGLAGGWLGPKYGRAVLQAGLLTLVAGMGMLWLTLHWTGMGTTAWDLVPALLVAGLGSGCVFAPLFDIILAGVTEREVGSASGVLTALQQFGGAAGVALIATVFFQLLPVHAFVGSMQWVIALSAGLFLLSFGCAFVLPSCQKPNTP